MLLTYSHAIQGLIDVLKIRLDLFGLNPNNTAVDAKLEESSMKISRVSIYFVVLFFIFAQTAPAIAGIVGTDKFLTEQSIQQDREELRNLMDRKEVRQLLENNGLTVEIAQERVDSLTDSEVRQLSQQFNELPAAGNAAVVILVIALVVIILELAGITDIFTGL